MYDRSAAEGEALLLSVLPLVTSSTGLVTSDQNIYALNFWTLFCAEAQILESCLIDEESRIDKRSTFYLDTLEQILRLFESLVNESVLSPIDVSLVCNFATSWSRRHQTRAFIDISSKKKKLTIHSAFRNPIIKSLPLFATASSQATTQLIFNNSYIFLRARVSAGIYSGL
jgi:hypothetical protein